MNFTPVYIVREELNNIDNKHLIKIGKNWEFCFLEDNDFIESPVKAYYFISWDLSINIYLRLKWARYGWFFFKSLDEALDDEEYYEGINFNESINPNFEKLKYKRILYVDTIEFDSFSSFKKTLETDYTEVHQNENSAIHFKLKVNASEFILLQSELFPRLCEFR